METKNPVVVTASIEWEKKDYLNLLGTYYGRPLVVLLHIILLPGVIFSPLALWSTIFEGFKPSLPLYLLMSITIYFYLYQPLKIIRILIHKIRRSEFNQREQFSCNENGISVESNLGKLKLDWDRIYRVIEHKKFFIFFINKYSPAIIPKRIFSKEDIETLRQIIGSNLPSKKFKRKV